MIRYWVCITAAAAFAMVACRGEAYVPYMGNGSQNPPVYANYGDTYIVQPAVSLAYPDGVANPMPGPPQAAINSGPIIPTSASADAEFGPPSSAIPLSTQLAAHQMGSTSHVETVDPQGRIVESSWYGGVEYFHWNERVAGSDFVNESGAIYTLGYEHRVGVERYRAELFGGDIHYSGYSQGGGFPPDALSSNTGYLGLAGQYEFVLAPSSWGRQAAFLLGVGSRFWIRDLHDGTSVSGFDVYGYQETWWSLYPYLGMETSMPVGDGLSLFSDVRCGPTCLTYQYVSIDYRPLWPKCGVYASTDFGIKSEHLYVNGYAEFMNWQESSVVEGAFQPKSQFFGVGVRSGFTF